MGNTTEEIIALEQRRCEAIATSNLDALADVLADDYLHVFGSGTTGDKQAYIKGIEDGPRVPERSNLRVRDYGDIAILNGDLLNRLNFPEREPRVVDAFVTQVARRENDGQWRFVSFHLTPKRPV